MIHGFADDDKQCLYEMYYQFGPTPRICFNFLKNNYQLIEYKINLNDELDKPSLETLRGLISTTQKFSMDAVSHTIILVKRVSKKELREANLDDSDRVYLGYASVEPITRAVVATLRVQLRKRTRADRLLLYQHLASIEGTRRIAGLVDE